MNVHGITHTARLKTHKDGSVEVLAASSPVFREPGWEERRRGGRKVAPPSASTAVEAVELSVWELERAEELDRRRDSDSLARSKRRARTNVRDIALNTPFRYFVTLTLDGARINRYDPAAVIKALSTWCDNQVRRKGLAYVLVAELHQDGAIHFHGFFNDALPVVDSGTMVPPGGGKPKRPRSGAQRAAWAAQGGRVVYNLPAWTLGFTTAIELYGDRYAAVGYVCKYITKAEAKVGGRWYYSGGALGRPEVEYLDLNVEDLAADERARAFTADSLPGVQFVTLTVRGGDENGAVSGEQAVLYRADHARRELVSGVDIGRGGEGVHRSSGGRGAGG